jgi:hypothetical protein
MVDATGDLRDRYLKAIIGVLRLWQQDGVPIDKTVFEDVKRQHLENASDRARSGIESITWDEVRARLDLPNA